MQVVSRRVSQIESLDGREVSLNDSPSLVLRPTRKPLTLVSRRTFNTPYSRSSLVFLATVMPGSWSLMLKRLRSWTFVELSARKMSIRYFSSLICTVSATERFRFVMSTV